jgi:formamidopyrimidine-DNA glycosylase
MPELPEVETIKRCLEKEIIGKKILAVKILDKKALKANKNSIVKRKILEIERIGKMLNLKLDENINLLFHLKMTGQLLYLKKLDNLKPRIIFYLSKGFLVFNDVRKFGWVKVLTDKERNKEVSKLGVDALKLIQDSNKAKIYFQNILTRTKRPIKLVLMDQRKIAGIGNIYANDILFKAKINPKMPANKISEKQIIDLIKAIKEILKKAINLEGTSFRFYLKPDASKGNYQEKFLVYQREGEKCSRCKSKIKKIVLGGRSTFYCPYCQSVI